MIADSTAAISVSNPTLGRRGWIAAVGLLAVVFGLYARTVKFQFVNYDDEVYVYANIHIITGFTLANIHYALTATVNGNWHPLTTLAWLLLASLFGVSPGLFHFTNALLHALNTVLLFTFLFKSTGRLWPGIFAAALWGLHPLRVESVAWVSELKDTLCGTMWLGCMLFYVSYSWKRTIGRYGLVVVAFVLALLAKPVAVTLPFVLLLLDYWPLGADSSVPAVKRWTRLILEKLPLLVLSAAAVVIGIHSQYAAHTNFSPSVFLVSLRIKNACVSYVAYLRDTFYPNHLVAFYPHPALVTGAGISWVSALTALAILLVITIAACAVARSRPYCFVGWFWFLGTLVPNLGLLQSGNQARADRFTYFPAMGFAIGFVWLIAEWARAWPKIKFLASTAGVTACIALAWVANRNLGYWRNGDSLLNHMLDLQPDNYLALTMKGNELQATGHIEEALALDQRAISICPIYASSYIDYAIALLKAGRYAEAFAEAQKASNLDPWDGQAWDCMGNIRDKQAALALASHNVTEEQDFRTRAITDFRAALKVAPDMPDATVDLARELATTGQLDEAITLLKQLVEKIPTFAQAQGDLADALRLQKKYPEAMVHYRDAIDAGSKNPAWETELAFRIAISPLATPADVQPMVKIAKDACDQTHDHDPGALDAYAACLARTGQFDLAINAAEQAVAAANAEHQPVVAAEIQKRLDRYKQALPYTNGE